MLTRTLGYRRALDGGPRDRDAKHHLGTLPIPPTSDLKHLLTVLDQGPFSSCVGNSVANALRGAQLSEGAPTSTPVASRWAIYWLARSLAGEQDQDAGAFIHLAFQALNTFGFCPEPAWPYTTDDDRWKKTPPLSALEQAFDQRLTKEGTTVDYQRILSDGQDRIDDVKRALGAGHLVVFGTEVSEDFCSGKLDSDGLAHPPGPDTPIAGGHAMVWCGHTPDYVEGLTSWGTGVFDGGFYRMSWDYVTADVTSDLWIVVACPRYATETT